jgi:hypothetical protein
MSNPIPNQLALTNIADGSQRVASPLRNNYAAIQAAVNELIVALTGGANGQTLQAVDATDVQWSYQGGIYRKTTPKIVNNTIVETDLLNGEITIAAGVLGTTGMLRLTVFMDILNNSGGIASWRFKVKLGGVVVFDSGAYNVTNSGSPRTSARMQFEMLNTGAANANVCSVRFVLPAISLANFSQVGTGTPADAGSGEKFNISEGTGTSAIDTATSKLLEVTVTHGTAAATIETKLYGAVVEVL